jgi:anti-repressor protein
MVENQNEPDFRLVKSYFYKTEYIDAKGEGRPIYVMNQDGFNLLTMGFTGAKAMQFKLQYIAEFNRMKAELERAKQLFK